MRFRTARTAVGLAVGMLLLAGCGSIPQPRTGADARWEPIANTKELTAASKRFDEVSAAALSKLEAKPLRKVYDGPLLRSSRAAVRLARKSDKYETRPAAHRDLVFHRPTFDNYPVWYVRESVATEPDDADSRLHPEKRELALVQSTGAASGFRMALRASVPAKQLPELEPTAIPNDDTERLGRSPSSIAKKFAAVVSAEKKMPKQADAFTKHEEVSDWRDTIASHMEYDGDYFDYRLEAKPTLVRALTTSDGGALVLFTVRTSETMNLLGGYLIFEKNTPVRVLQGRKEFHEWVDQTREWTVAAKVPPKQAEKKKIELLFASNDFVRASGA